MMRDIAPSVASAYEPRAATAHFNACIGFQQRRLITGRHWRDLFPIEPGIVVLDYSIPAIEAYRRASGTQACRSSR